jgi:hypothetical protein
MRVYAMPLTEENSSNLSPCLAGYWSGPPASPAHPIRGPTLGGGPGMCALL